mgnify:FL=1
MSARASIHPLFNAILMRRLTIIMRAIPAMDLPISALAAAGTINIIIPAMASISSIASAGAMRCGTLTDATGPDNEPNLAGITPEDRIGIRNDMQIGVTAAIYAVMQREISGEANIVTTEPPAATAATGR